MVMNEGAVLGIDVGYSERRPTTCFCLLQWADDLVHLVFKPVGTDPRERVRALDEIFPSPQHLAAVAIDGPLTRGLRVVSHYRAADALLSRGVFQKRGKPGQTSSPVGQNLHQHATQLAELVLKAEARGRLSLAPAVHIEPIHPSSIVEAFPNQFLAVLIDELDLPDVHRDASDRYWEQLAVSSGLERALARLLPGFRFATKPANITDHDERAAAVCALRAVSVATASGVGVGDPEDGDIFLPPVALWGASRSGTQPWAEAALRGNVATVRLPKRSFSTNHRKVRVRCHGTYWIH